MISRIYGIIYIPIIWECMTKITPSQNINLTRPKEAVQKNDYNIVFKVAGMALTIIAVIAYARYKACDRGYGIHDRCLDYAKGEENVWSGSSLNRFSYCNEICESKNPLNVLRSVGFLWSK